MMLLLILFKNAVPYKRMALDDLSIISWLVEQEN